MPKKLNLLYQDLLRYLKDNEWRENISISQIQNSLWIDHHQKVVHRLKQLEKRGYIRKDHSSWWYKTYENPVENTISIPVYWEAKCWNKQRAIVQEQPERYLDFPTSILWKWDYDLDEYFFVEASGDSMNPTVENWDLALIKISNWNRGDWKKVLVVHDGNLKIKIIQQQNWNYYLISTNAEKLEIMPEEKVDVIWYVKTVVKTF